jgi:2,5-furandicarboxylate decarboxylase 1
MSDEQLDWAMATRFQPARDLIVATGYRTLPHDPSLDGLKVMSKAGFDLTLPFGKRGAMELSVPEPPARNDTNRRFATARDALEDGPKTFEDLCAALGSRDGRDVVLAMDELRQAGELTRVGDGEWALIEGDEAG